MKNLLTITFLFIAGIAFAQPVRTTVTDDGVNVTVQTPVNIKVIPICDFHWVFVDGQLKMWIEGGNELIPGGRLGNFTINGATTQQAKLDALGAISAQCAGGGAGGTLTDGNKGDITVSDSGAVWNINAGVIGSTEIANGGVGWVDLAQAVKDSIGVNLGRIFYVSSNGNNSTAEVGNPNRPWADPTVVPALMSNGDIMEFLNPQDTFNMQGGIYIDSLQDITINGNNAVLKLAPSSQTATTLAANYTGGTSISVSSVPASWKVGDFLRLSKGIDNANISNSSRITNISGTTITINAAFAIQTGGTFTANAGHNVVEDIKIIYGRPSETENGLIRGSNKRYKIKNIRFDGNRANNTINYSWVLHGAILLHGQGGDITGCDFREFPAEFIIGGGMAVHHNNFENGGGSPLHISVHDNTFYNNSGSRFSNNTVKNCNQIAQSVNGHNEGNITFSWNGGDMVVDGNTFIDTTETISNSILGVVTGAEGVANDRENLIFTNNICTGYEKIFFAMDATIHGVNVVNNIFFDCGMLTTNTGSLDTVTTIKFCNNLALGGTVLNISSRQKCDPVTSTGTQLDVAYNNFGANPSKIDINAAEGQTGGLVWETAAGINHEMRTGASGGFYVTRWGLASQPTRFNIRALSGSLTLAGQESGQHVTIQTPTGGRIVRYLESRLMSYDAAGADTLLASGPSRADNGVISFNSSGTGWKNSYRFDQIGSIASNRFALVEDFGPLNDLGSVQSTDGYALRMIAFTMNGSSGGRRYDVFRIGNPAIVAITGTRTDTLCGFRWRPTINSTGGGFQNWAFDVQSGIAWFRAGTSLNALGDVVLSKTISVSTGAATINALSGTVIFAAGESTLVVTNSFVNTSSIVTCQVEGTDATFTSCRVTKGSGSFTITANAAATGNTTVAFRVTN